MEACGIRSTEASYRADATYRTTLRKPLGLVLAEDKTTSACGTTMCYLYRYWALCRF